MVNNDRTSVYLGAACSDPRDIFLNFGDSFRLYTYSPFLLIFLIELFVEKVPSLSEIDSARDLYEELKSQTLWNTLKLINAFYITYGLRSYRLPLPCSLRVFLVFRVAFGKINLKPIVVVKMFGDLEQVECLELRI